MKEPAVTDNSAKEAPMLTKLVDEGKLPALAERLPASKDIMVEEVVEEIGQYGGDWNMPWTGVPDKWGDRKSVV